MSAIKPLFNIASDGKEIRRCRIVMTGMGMTGAETDRIIKAVRKIESTKNQVHMRLLLVCLNLVAMTQNCNVHFYHYSAKNRFN